MNEKTTLEEMIERQDVLGIEAVVGLRMNVETWKRAHGYHADLARLHACLSHRPGIVYGLEVRKAGMQLSVASGLATDPNGNLIIVAQKFKLPVDKYFANLGDTERNVAHIVAACRDYKPDPKTGQFHEYHHCSLVPLSKFTAEGSVYVELARFDPEQKLDNLMLNHDFRQYAYPRCYADLNVWVPDSTPKEYRDGLFALTRVAEVHGCVLRPASIGGGKDTSLVYLAGDRTLSLTRDEQKTLADHVERGGVVFAEAGVNDTGFTTAFEAFAREKRWQLDPVGPRSKLLSSHYRFPDFPLGGRAGGAVRADRQGRVFLSTRDFGLAWAGQIPQNGASRERIREAEEFGVNLAVWAAACRREANLDAYL